MMRTKTFSVMCMGVVLLCSGITHAQEDRQLKQLCTGWLPDESSGDPRLQEIYNAYSELASEANNKKRSKGFRDAAEALRKRVRGEVAEACRGGVPLLSVIHVSDSPPPGCVTEIGRNNDDSAALICVIHKKKISFPSARSQIQTVTAGPESDGEIGDGDGTADTAKKVCVVDIEAGVLPPNAWHTEPLETKRRTLTVPYGKSAVIHYTQEKKWVRADSAQTSIMNDNLSDIQAEAIFDLSDDCKVTLFDAANKANDPPPVAAEISVVLKDAERKHLVAAASDLEIALDSYLEKGREIIRKRFNEADDKWNALSKVGYSENILEALVNGKIRERRLRAVNCPLVGQEYACDKALDPLRVRIILLHPSIGLQMYDTGKVNDERPKLLRPVFFLEAVGFNAYAKSFKYYFGLGAGIQISGDGLEEDFRPGILIHPAPFVDVGVTYSTMSDGFTFSLGTDLFRLINRLHPSISKSTLTRIHVE